MKIGDKVYWEDYDNPKTSIKGEVTNIIGNNIIITWENKRITQYTPDMIASMKDSYGGMVKIDYQFIRDEKLKSLGI